MEHLETLQMRVTAAMMSVNRMYLKLAFESSDLSALRFAEDVLSPVLDQLGKRWEQGELSLAQIYMSGRLCEALLEESLPTGGLEVEGQLQLAVAVLEDFHVLGKRIVCSVLRAGATGLPITGRLRWMPWWRR